MIEPEPSRDHTERLLARAGVPDRARRRPDRRSPSTTSSSSATIHVPGRPVLGGVPHRRGDPRQGLADRDHRHERELDADRLRPDRASAWAAIVVGDLEAPRPDEIATDEPVTASSTSPPARWSAPTVEPHEVPLAIDELPLVALLGCFAEGETVVTGAQELQGQGVRPDRDRRRRPARPRRRHRGHRRRLRRHAAPAACAAARSRPTATTAWRCSARSPASRAARASRSSGWTPP